MFLRQFLSCTAPQIQRGDRTRAEPRGTEQSTEAQSRGTLQRQARLAIVAVHLDMVDDAEQLLLAWRSCASMCRHYGEHGSKHEAVKRLGCCRFVIRLVENHARKKCGRFDLLNQLYQVSCSNPESTQRKPLS